MVEKFDMFDSSDAASCFLDLIEEKLQHQPDYILPVMAELVPAILHVSSNQVPYNADINIYRDF